MAGGAARSRRSSTPISGSIWKPKTTTPRACSATPRRCRRSWSQRCAGGSRKTIPACRRRMARSPICASSARAASTRCSAAPRATAATSRSCSTATRWRPATSYFKFGGARHSPDHTLQAWSADTKGSEYFSIRVRDWASGKDSDDLVEETDGGVVWSKDAKSFFYVKLDDNHRPMQVWRHRLGTQQADDALVYEEQDSGWFTHLHESASGRFCVIAGGDHETSEQRLIDLGASRSAAAAGRGARGRRAIFDRRPRRRTVHPHQRR